MFDLIVNSIDGVSRVGAFGSLETYVNGILLTVAHTSAINEVSTSCEMSLCLGSNSMTFKTFFETPMILSHALPMCGA